jgi:hypothetical protein
MRSAMLGKHDFYQALLTKGMQPTMARLTLARKIAAITLIVWKKGARFDPQHLKQQVVWAPLAESPFHPGDHHPWRLANRSLETLGIEGEYQ